METYPRTTRPVGVGAAAGGAPATTQAALRLGSWLAVRARGGTSASRVEQQIETEQSKQRWAEEQRRRKKITPHPYASPGLVHHHLLSNLQWVARSHEPRYQQRLTRAQCSPHSARSWNLGRELRRSVSTRGSREAVSRSGRIQFGCIPVAAGPFTPVRLVNRLLVRCLLIRASDVTVHPYSPYLVSVITHA